MILGFGYPKPSAVSWRSETELCRPYQRILRNCKPKVGSDRFAHAFAKNANRLRIFDIFKKK